MVAVKMTGAVYAVQKRAWWAPLLVAGLGLVLLYRPLLPTLFAVPLSRQVNEGLGLFALFLAAWLIWQRRAFLQTLPRLPDPQGLWLFSLGAFLALVSYRLSLRFPLAISLACLVAGSVWWVLGRQWVVCLWFPLLLLVAVAPFPVDLVEAIAAPSQAVAARLAAFLLGTLSVPVERLGAALLVRGHALQVNETCSGWHLFSAAVWLFLLLLYWQCPCRWARWLLALPFLFPFAVLANTLRVTTVAFGLAFHQRWVTASPWHELMGIGFFLLLAIGLVRWLSPSQRSEGSLTPQPLRWQGAPSGRTLWALAAGVWLVWAAGVVLARQGQQSIPIPHLPHLPSRLGAWGQVAVRSDDPTDGGWFTEATYRTPDGEGITQAFLQLPLKATHHPLRFLSLWRGMGYEVVGSRLVTVASPRRLVPLQLVRLVKDREWFIVVTYLHPERATPSLVGARLQRIWEQLLYGVPRPWVAVGIAAPDERTALTLGRDLVAFVEQWLVSLESSSSVQGNGGEGLRRVSFSG